MSELVFDATAYPAQGQRKPKPYRSEAATLAAFADAIRAAGLTPPEAIEADGAIHRFSSSGKL